MLKLALAFLRPFLPQILIAALLLGAIAYIDHRGYVRGQTAANARYEKAEKAAADRQAEMQRQIAQAIEKIDAALGKKLAKNDEVGRAAQSVIAREVAANPSLANCKLTPAMVDAINKVRAQSND